MKTILNLLKWIAYAVSFVIFLILRAMVKEVAGDLLLLSIPLIVMYGAYRLIFFLLEKVGPTPERGDR